MTDKYTAIRAAIAAGPTPGPWSLIPQHGAGPMLARQYETGKQMQPTGLRLIAHFLQRDNSLPEDKANADYIAAASPDIIATLLAERDALRSLLADSLETMTCGDTGDAIEDSHRCGRCDEYVDRNATLRANIRTALAMEEGNE